MSSNKYEDTSDASDTIATSATNATSATTATRPNNNLTAMSEWTPITF